MSDVGALLGDFPETIASLAQDGAVRRFKKRSIIVSEGDAARSLFVLLDGRVRIYSQGENGNELDFGFADPGEIFGEMSLDGGARIASVEADSDCICAEVAYSVLKDKIAASPEFAFLLISTLIERSRSATESAKSLALKTVYQRVKDYLEGEATLNDGVKFIEGRGSYQDIANRVGASRDMVSKVFKELIAGKYVEMSASRLVFLRDLPARW